MIRLEGETLPQEARGAVPPILFGDLLRDVPGIPVQVGWAATLADNCGIDLSVTTLRLGGADLAETLAAVPAAGVVQIDNEWLRYSKILADPPRLTIAERGYRETEPAAHDKGATVWFVETRPLYVFAYVPPGCSYPGDMVVQLRVNDNAETPPATVRLQDDRLVPGVRLVTVEFDASRAFFTQSAVPLPSSVVMQPVGVGLAGDQAERTGWHIGPAFTPTRPFAGHEYVPPPTMQRGPTPVAAPFAGNGGQRIVSLRQGVLGRVTADLRGLRDTSAGRYSGVPLGRLVQPAAITRLILEETYGETAAAAYHAPTWTTTAARHAARGLTWRLAWRGDVFESFRRAAQLCGQADLYLDDDGRWRYAFRDPVAPAVGTITPRELLDDPALGWSPGREVITVLEVAWGAGLQGGTVTLDSPYMIPRHGRNHGGVALPYAATDAIARQLARYQLSRRDRPRQSLSVRASHAWLGLTVTDRVFVETPLLGLYGAKRVPFEIVGITDRGDQRTLALLEADPLARELLLSGSLYGAGQLVLDLSGTLDVLGPMARPLSGTLVLARVLAKTLAGTLVRPGGPVTLTLAGTLIETAGAAVVLALAGTLIRPATPLSRPLAGTRATPAVLTRTLAGSLDTTPPPAVPPLDGFVHGEPGSRIDY